MPPLARCEPGGLPPTCPPKGRQKAALLMGGLFLGEVGRVEAKEPVCCDRVGPRAPKRRNPYPNPDKAQLCVSEPGLAA